MLPVLSIWSYNQCKTTSKRSRRTTNWSRASQRTHTTNRNRCPPTMAILPFNSRTVRSLLTTMRIWLPRCNTRKCTPTNNTWASLKTPLKRFSHSLRPSTTHSNSSCHQARSRLKLSSPLRPQAASKWWPSITLWQATCNTFQPISLVGHTLIQILSFITKRPRAPLTVPLEAENIALSKPNINLLKLTRLSNIWSPKDSCLTIQSTGTIPPHQLLTKLCQV